MRIKTNNTTDFFCVLIPLIAQLLLAHYLQEFKFIDNNVIRWMPVIFSLTPVILFYFLLRFIAPPLLSATITSFILTALSLVHKTKFALTSEPLVWGDLTTSANLAVITQYVSPLHFVIVLLFFAMFWLAFKLNPDINHKNFYSKLLVISLLTPIVAASSGINEYVESFSPFARKINKTGKVVYMSWDWAANIRMNGLPLHLIQTSRRRIPATPTEQEKKEFAALAQKMIPAASRPKNIFIILCEACWHDQVHFKEAFSPLEDLGLAEFRTISPVYGGGTVNATFEFLTGLPAKGKLNGIIYQEYAALISNQAHAFPQYLRKSGYETIDAHNFNRAFWKRNIVNPKLGFDTFIALEDMQNDSESYFPDDSVLFNAVTEKMRRIERPTFFFLTTVYTHGGYKFNHDFGENNYKNRLTTTIQRISDFIREIQSTDSDSLILIFGDHKPTLTKYFYENNIIKADQFSDVGTVNEDFAFRSDYSRELRGDVPAYIYYRDQKKVAEFVAQANNLPVFCLGQMLDTHFTKVSLPTFNYARDHQICANFHQLGYKSTVRQYPSWLYAISLF